MANKRIDLSDREISALVKILTGEVRALEKHIAFLQSQPDIPEMSLPKIPIVISEYASAINSLLKKIQ